MHLKRIYAVATAITGALLISLNSYAQQLPVPQPAPPKDWHAMDYKADGYYGVSLKQAYEFLKGKKSKTVIVTTIDSGIDTAQKDLAPVLWVNPKEIPANGKDDDNDGYTDDVHGWDFLGGRNGKVDNDETEEEVRQYYKLKDKYSGLSQAPAGQEKQYAFWLNAKRIYDTTENRAEAELKELQFDLKIFTVSNNVIKHELNLGSDGTFVLADLDKVKPSTDSMVIQSKAVWQAVFTQLGGADLTNAKVLKDWTDEYKKQNNTVNPDLDARKNIVGDDPDINDGKPYGNNILKNTEASHGTGVAGLIGAVRNNGYGIDGVADNVRIMALKAVPNGDEYDKDVANAIRYAVDHGAEVVNMSFGKKISPHKDWVDAAFKYAAAHDVLLVMASGNESQDVDAKPEFPNDRYLDGTTTDNVISVGASAWKPDTSFVADFSNYGQKTVDIFAPGVKVTSIDMDAEFNTEDGTSFSAPIVSGIACLIREYYPKLTAAQVKQAILQSATPVKVMVNKPGGKGQKVEFTTLSKTGGIVNAYRALEIASKMKGEKK